MPVNRRYPLAQLLRCAAPCPSRSGRITFEYVLWPASTIRGRCPGVSPASCAAFAEGQSHPFNPFPARVSRARRRHRPPLPGAAARRGGARDGAPGRGQDIQAACGSWRSRASAPPRLADPIRLDDAAVESAGAVRPDAIRTSPQCRYRRHRQSARAHNRRARPGAAVCRAPRADGLAEAPGR